MAAQHPRHLHMETTSASLSLGPWVGPLAGPRCPHTPGGPLLLQPPGPQSHVSLASGRRDGEVTTQRVKGKAASPSISFCIFFFSPCGLSYEKLVSVLQPLSLRGHFNCERKELSVIPGERHVSRQLSKVGAVLSLGAQVALSRREAPGWHAAG